MDDKYRMPKTIFRLTMADGSTVDHLATNVRMNEVGALEVRDVTNDKWKQVDLVTRVEFLDHFLDEPDGNDG
jgi:hypothetical protein